MTGLDGAASILVFGDSDREDCGELLNVATVDGRNNDDDVPEATATITVKCPTIAIDKENERSDRCCRERASRTP